MTDNEMIETCFICEMVAECVLVEQTNVHLCEPCIEELDQLRW